METEIAQWVGYAAGVLLGIRYTLAAVVRLLDAIDMRDGSADWPWVRVLASAVERLDNAIGYLPVKRLGRDGR